MRVDGGRNGVGRERNGEVSGQGGSGKLLEALTYTVLVSFAPSLVLTLILHQQMACTEPRQSIEEVEVFHRS